jgi:hypothetical protein
MRVLPIKSEQTYPWLLNKHYAKRIPNIMFAFGLYVDDELKGIVTFGMPASNYLCFGVCGREHQSKVLELNRLCLMDNVKNQSSFLVSNAIKLLPKPSIIVSYADSGKGHVNYVYQATNFLFTGTTKERTDMFAGEGKHSRHGTSNGKRQLRTAKHRYVYFHGSKTEKKLLIKSLNYKVMPYPKGETKNYDSGGQVITQKILF